MSDVKWLDRHTVVTPHFCLVTNKGMYRAVVSDTLDDEWPVEWITKNHGATTHTYVKPGNITCVVCVDGSYCFNHEDQIVVIGIIVHEAAHIYQELLKSIGEVPDGAEFEAYSLQNITQQLLWSYQEQRNAYFKLSAVSDSND